MTMKIRGSTQILDDSVTLDKLEPGLQELLTKQWYRQDFTATEGQTLFVVGSLNPSDAMIEVYRNGLFLNPAEYSVINGGLTLNTEASAGEIISITYGDSPVAGILNADQLNGQAASYYLNPANLGSAVPVTKGGTGATSAAAARAALGAEATLVSGTNIKTVNGSSLLGSGDLPVGQSGRVAASYTAGGTTTLTYAQDAVYAATAATGGTTWAISGLPADGTVASWSVELTNGGSQTQAWFANTKWDGGTAPTLTASGLDILTFYTHNGGTTIRGFLAAKDSK